ncbi:hypothetical protein [Yinghuangia sp. YIM S09857]|uniref:hypothetical protein n=1 Tax=Yinghuangia sp. YIM S09857 TaxID=3436929 RepID=UPI003F535FA7
MTPWSPATRASASGGKATGRQPRWEAAEAASPEEIATAVADTECMAANNVAGVWFAVESAYQKREIEANSEKLEEVRKAIDTSMRVAEEITPQV